MKNVKLTALALVFLLFAALAAGCGAGTNAPTAAPTPETTPEATPETPVETPADTSISFTDMTGREIVLAAPATKVVALTASDCEILFAIGAGDALVGRGEYCDYPAEVLEVVSVESGYNTNIEQIIALAPQAVVMSTMAQSEEQVSQLEGAGIAVIALDAQDIAGVYEAIEIIGKLTGHDAEAEALIGSMKATFEQVASDAAANGVGGAIYFEVSPLQHGLWAAGGGSFMNEIAQMLGLTNIFAELGPWAEVSEEQVIERNPDYILTVSMYFGEGPTPEEELLSRAGWENVAAIKNGAILNIATNELSRPGPRLADGARMLYDFIYAQMSVQNAA